MGTTGQHGLSISQLRWSGDFLDRVVWVYQMEMNLPLEEMLEAVCGSGDALLLEHRLNDSKLQNSFRRHFHRRLALALATEIKHAIILDAQDRFVHRAQRSLI